MPFKHLLQQKSLWEILLQVRFATANSKRLRLLLPYANLYKVNISRRTYILMKKVRKPAKI
nr:MAG TPA: hypothetical protein [Caudoviricetes sp.]